MRVRMCVLLLSLAFCACVATPVKDKKAQATLARIEQQLLDARVLRIDYEIEARGAVSADISGDLLMQQPALAALRATGDFATQPVQPMLVADGTTMRGGTASYFSQPAPAQLRDGLLLGLTRMGVLHNIAMLTQDAPPDATDGSIRDWVTVANVRAIDQPRRIGGRTVAGLHFDLIVAGEPAGAVTLWYEPDTALPVAREQLVQFETGEMRVVERYTVSIDGIIGPCRFDTGALTSD
ncbi:MAG: hypothetical protein HKO55_09185 [Gammaproteobacteria bacterium]|nr:hypothetical protein [Gammaproteobacteria bacterium]